MIVELEAVLFTLIFALAIALFLVSYLTVYFWRRWQKRQTLAYQIGGSQVKGDIYQLLGTFAVLQDYEQVIMLSTTSRQASLDLIGVKPDMIDFIEFKKKGGTLRGPERKIKKLVDDKMVRYVIKDVELPEELQLSDRERKRVINKNTP